MDEEERLSLVFGALADPTRRKILEKLADGVQTVAELAEPFQISAPAITKHLKVLEDAGLIKRSRIAQTRPCELKPEGLQKAAGWIESYREHWDQQLDRLDSFLKTVQKDKKEKTDERKSKKPD